MKTVVWYGNAGSRHGDFGIPNLRIAAPGLAAASKRIPLRLRVISNDEARFSAVTADFPFPCEFKTWRRGSALNEISRADLCVAPNSRDPFSLAKSANRLVLALSLGVPVVATSTPAAEPLRPFVIFDDWEAGVATYLLNPARARADVAAAQPFISANYEPQVIAAKWAGHLSNSKPAPEPEACGSAPMAFIESEEDLAAFFLLRNALGPPALALAATTDFLASRPEMVARLRAAGVELNLLSRGEILRGRAVISARRSLFIWGSQLIGRRASRALMRTAKQAGVPVFSAADLAAGLVDGATHD